MFIAAGKLVSAPVHNCTIACERKPPVGANRDWVKLVQRHISFLAKAEGKAGRVVFSNEKLPQWQKCNAHWRAPTIIHYSSFEIGEATKHSEFTVPLDLDK